MTRTRVPRTVAALALVGLLALLPAVGALGSARPAADLRARGEPWRPPVADLRLVTPFDAPAAPWLAGHRGADLDAPVGTRVLAPRGGVVQFAGVVVDRPVLTLLHDDGLRSSFEPVEALLPVGTRVAAGEVVGTVTGARSHCAPTCLHWGVRDGETYLDPMLLLTGGPVVLLAAGVTPGARPAVSRGRPP
jgi:murein DD-endopeptidase MepM/ murein hydrolase activator NlpD